MNIGSMHSDEDDFYLPLWPTSSTTLSAPSFTSHDQSGNSGTIGLFNELITADSSFQTLDVPSLPMHSQYYSTTAEVHAEDFNFLKNVNSELDPQLPMPELSDEYPSLWPEVPPTLRQYYIQEMPNENPQEIRPDFSLSTYTFPEGNVLEGLMGTDQENIINGATSSLSNIVEGNPASSHINGIGGSENHAGSNQTGKTSQLPDNRVDRRRGFRKKPKRSHGERGSIYRGVSRYTGRFEAFLWDNTNPGEKPKTVYVGGFDNEKEAARAYDLAALKLWGEAAPINFSLSDYKKEMEEMQYMTKKEYLLSIRRKSRGFSKGISSYRGVSRNSDYKKWQARLGKGRGMRSIYIGTFGTEEEAARAYDVAAIRMKGLKAVTNFELSNYDVNGILACEKLPIGKGASKLLKKTSVDDFLLTKRNTGKTPTLCLPLENPSSSQPNSQHDEQSFEQFNTLATAPNNLIISPYFQQNCNNANQVFHQNLSSSFPLYATQELTQIGGGETSGGNLSESSNLVFPCNGVWGEHSLTMMETNELMANSGILPSWNQPIQPSDHSQFHQSYEHTSQLLQPQILSLPFLGHKNPNFLTNPDFLHGSISAATGLERNGTYMGGNLNGGFPGENHSVLDGNSTVRNTGDYSDLGISWGGIQQVEELDQTFQTLQQNQMFQFHQDAGNDINGLLQDQNPDPSHSREIQNLESQTNPNNFLYGCLTGVDQMNVGTNNVNFSSCVGGLAGSSWFPEESLMVMETAEKMNSNADHDSNGGFRIHETPIFMEGNSAPRSLDVEKGDQLSEDFGLDMRDFGIDSFELDGSTTFLDELISSF